MGQTLSEPVTNKETAICQDDNYKVNLCDDSCERILLDSPDYCVVIIYNPPVP